MNKNHCTFYLLPHFLLQRLSTTNLSSVVFFFIHIKAWPHFGNNMQEESHFRRFPFSCYPTISFTALSVSQQPCLTVHADYTTMGSDYTDRQHTVWGDKDYSNNNQTHIENCTFQKHWHCWAIHSLTLKTASVKWHSANLTTAVEYWFCCYNGAGFISPFKVLKHVKLPGNKWVRKHLTHGNVWSAVVCFESQCFSTACMVGHEKTENFFNRGG